MVSLAPSEAAGSCDQLCAVTEMELRRESEQEKKLKEEISHVMEEVEEEIHSEDKLAAPASSLGEDPFGNPILWKGIIHSTEIAPPTFPVSASNLGGLCDYLTSDLPEKPERLTMVGKIEPDRVWKYIDKVRISKEIAILMLQTEAEHSTTYQELFDWMHSKRRYCVVQGHSSMVKDFYLVPIPKGSSGPTEMTNYLSLEGSRALSGSHEDVITGILVRYPRIRGTPPAVLAAPHAKPSTSQHRHGSSHRSHHHRHSNKREHHASSSSSSNGGSKLSPLPPAVTKIRDLPPPPTISAPSPVPPPPISNKPLPPPPISSKPLPVAPPLAPPPSVPLNVPVSSIPLPPDEEEIPSHQKMLLELNRQIEEEQSQLAKLRETAGDAAPYSPSMLDQEEISPIAVARDPIVEAYQRTTRKSAPADEDISLVDMDLDDQAPSSSATSSSAAVPAARTVAPSSTPSSSSTSSDVSVPSDPRRLRR